MDDITITAVETPDGWVWEGLRPGVLVVRIKEWRTFDTQRFWPFRLRRLKQTDEEKAAGTMRVVVKGEQ